MGKEVTEFIENVKLAWQVDICKQLDQTVHQSVPEVTDRIQYGKPHYLKNGKYIAVLGAAKGWVSFTIFNAQAVEAPQDLFESSDTGDRKTIKIREGQDVDYSMVGKLVQKAASTL